MAIVFGAEYELLIGRVVPLMLRLIPKYNEGRLIQRGTNSEGIPTEDFNTIPANFRVFTDFQMTAKIAQTKSQSVKNTITIVGLDDDEIARFKRDDTVILRAGYRQTVSSYLEDPHYEEETKQHPEIFVGQIERVSTKWQGTEKITSILCGDSVTTKKNSKVSKSYLPTATRLEVLRDLIQLAKTQGVPFGGMRLPDKESGEYRVLTSTFLSGYTAKGNLFSEIEELCSSMSMRSFTALGKLYVEPSRTTALKDYVLKVPTDPNTKEILSRPVATSNVVFTVKPENVKNSIQPIDDGVGGTSNANGGADKSGIKLTTYLDGRISVSKIMRLKGFDEYGDYNGDYEITSVIHNLNYRDNPTWETQVTLSKL